MGEEQVVPGDVDFGAAGVDGFDDGVGDAVGRDLEEAGGVFGVWAEAGFGEFGEGAAGVDGGDGDVVGAEFHAEAATDEVDGGFGGAVEGEAGQGGLADDGGDIDDLAAALAFHVGDGGLGAVEEGEDVGVEEGLHVGRGDFVEAAVLAEAGVVDEDIEAAEVGDGVVD